TSAATTTRRGGASGSSASNRRLARAAWVSAAYSSSSESPFAYHSRRAGVTAKAVGASTSRAACHLRRMGNVPGTKTRTPGLPGIGELVAGDPSQSPLGCPSGGVEDEQPPGPVHDVGTESPQIVRCRAEQRDLSPFLSELVHLVQTAPG